MNRDTEDHASPFDDAAREREWLAQEAAMRRERLQLDPAGDDARGRRYRLLARALREPLAETLPADFARQVAAQVAAAPARQGTADSRFESALLFALAGVLIVAGGFVTAIYGRAWLQPFAELLPTFQASTASWPLVLAGCLGGSWLLGRWQQAPRTGATHS
jgi:hypothetical protein